MKVKQQLEDFCVEELTDIAPVDQGPFGFYRLEKRGWTTPDALAAIRRRWKLEPRRLSYGGLKDRYAVTTQYLSIFHGPQRNLNHQDVHVTYLGRIAAPYSSSDIKANRFRLVVRDLSREATAHAERALATLRIEGVPNYFDDQRLGSVTPGGTFIAHHLVLGQFEEALRLALAAPYQFDRAEQKKEKALLNAHWGEWPVLKERLPRGHARSLVDYLVHHPTDFRGAVARLRPELRGLYLSAYQSHLWNRMLSQWLQQHCRPEQLVPVPLRLGSVPMHQGLDDDQQRELRELTLPLPSARLHLEPDDRRADVVQAVLAEAGLELSQLKVKGIREMFFSRGERAALCLPEQLEYSASPDERQPGRQQLRLAFDLPRGCYATLIIKRITDAHGPVGASL